MNWLWWVLISSLFGAFAIIVKKKALIKEHATEFLTTFKFFEIITLVLFIPFMNFNISLELLFVVFIVSLITTIALVFIAKSYKHLELSMAAPLMDLGPAFTVAIAFIFLNEQLNTYQLIGVGFLIFGAYFLEASYHKGVINNIKSIISKKYVKILLFALILSAFAEAGHKYLISSISPLTLLFLSYVFNFIISFSISTILYKGYKDLIHGIKNSGKIIFIDAILATLSNITYLYAISSTMISLVLPIKRLSTLIAIIIGGRLFHEHNLMQRMLACIIMLFGITLIAL